MRHTSGIDSCPGEGEEMTGNDPNEPKLSCLDTRAFRDDKHGRQGASLPAVGRSLPYPMWCEVEPQASAREGAKDFLVLALGAQQQVADFAYGAVAAGGACDVVCNAFGFGVGGGDGYGQAHAT